MDQPPRSDRKRSRGPALAALVAVAVAVLAALVWTQMREQPPPPAPEVASAPVAEPKPPAEPEVRHPIEAVPVEPIPRAEPLPPRDQSDGALIEAVSALVGPGSLERWFFADALVRRFVVTVDNLPRETLPMQVRIARATPGSFLTAGGESAPTIHPENARRYEPFVAFVEAIDARKLVAIYVSFYPLLQEEYRAIGFPHGQFNDRVVQAIDDMLAAPELDGPIALVQPKVMYRFADPELESLSSGRKIMVRAGVDNARRLKAKLREIRRLLAGAAQAR